MATPWRDHGAASRYSRLLERRSTRRISTLLAGLIATATISATISPAAAAPPATTQDSTEQKTDTADAASPPADDDKGWIGEVGIASWYGQRHHGRRTASGTRFNQHAMTAAHPWLPLGAKVRVTRRDTGQAIVVTITDRLPSRTRVIDLSYGAAKRLGMAHAGLAEVRLEPA